MYPLVELMAALWYLTVGVAAGLTLGALWLLFIMFRAAARAIRRRSR